MDTEFAGLAEYKMTIGKHENSFRITVHRNDYHMALESRRCDMNDATSRRYALNGLCQALAHLLREDLFPEDTPIYGAFEGPAKMRYPDAK